MLQLQLLLERDRLDDDMVKISPKNLTKDVNTIGMTKKKPRHRANNKKMDSAAGDNHIKEEDTDVHSKRSSNKNVMNDSTGKISRNKIASKTVANSEETKKMSVVAANDNTIEDKNMVIPLKKNGMDYHAGEISPDEITSKNDASAVDMTEKERQYTGTRNKREATSDNNTIEGENASVNSEQNRMDGSAVAPASKKLRMEDSLPQLATPRVHSKLKRIGSRCCFRWPTLEAPYYWGTIVEATGIRNRRVYTVSWSVLLKNLC
jgi:hypothetical protein